MRFPSGVRPNKRDRLALAIGLGVTVLRRYGPLAAAVAFPVLLAGCGETPGDFGDPAYKPLSPQMLALMQEKGTTKDAPVLIRAFKQEAEVQIWKMKADGHYTLLKSYPICRWSGQLGPKKREGDRQVPEGYYTITPAQMNPRSNYYLSFNVGYPNTYDRAHGYTGGEIMVHGVCSSAGCFSMTDQQIAEIYAIARDAFAGGQRAIQMQSYPFHMTPENFAKYRLDPNIAFWKELKTGDDNFEVTKQEVAVGVCNDHYMFNAEPADGSAFDPTGPCPVLKRDRAVALEVAAKEKSDEAKVAELVAEGVQPVRTLYADGGQNPRFTLRRDDVSRPDALAEGPLNLPLNEGKTPSLARLEAAKRRAEAAAAAAREKAAAAHAYAYVDPAEATRAAQAPAAQPQFGLPQLMPGQGQGQGQVAQGQVGQAPAPQADPAASPVAPQPTPQPQPSGFGLSGLGRLFAGEASPPAAPPPVPNSLAEPHPADVPLPPPRMEARSQETRGLGLRGTEQRSVAKLNDAKPASKPEHSNLARSKPEQTGADQPKADQAKVEHPMVDQPKTDQPKTDQPKTDQAKTDQAKADQAKTDQAKADKPKSDDPNSIYGSMPIMLPTFSAAAATDH